MEIHIEYISAYIEIFINKVKNNVIGIHYSNEEDYAYL